MARVTYGGGVTEFAGSIGGVTFQKNASGQIAKLRSNPTVNPSALQATYQTNMSFLVAFWSTLSQVNKDLWDAYAIAHDHTTPWGDVKTLSGYQWFLTCNLMRLIYTSTPISTPPIWVAYSPPDAFTLAATVDHLRVEWVPAYNPSSDLRFFLTLPLRQSSLKLRRSLFYVGLRATGAALDNYDLTTLFESLANVTWADFWASADCSIICRITHGYGGYGLVSSFTSALVKI